MKSTIKTLLVASVLILSASAYAAQEDKSAPKMEGMQMVCAPDKECPMADKMGDMQTRMGAMMSNMQGMMDQIKDPAMKEKMQKMHEDMSGMMQNMQQMHEKMGEMSGMMGNGMMGGAQKPKSPQSNR